MDYMINIDNVSKQYRLGTIGGGTLQGDIEAWWAKKHGKDDPNSRIGAKKYERNESFYALTGISFSVKKGERVGIIGHNGAGKSTLLKLLTRVTAPTTGEIGLNGRVASMLEVGTGFHGELTGRENIYMNGAILGMTRKEIDSKIDDIINFSECGQFIDTPVKRYSSGMYVKLAFSVAAHLNSEILIMDEVLAVGDMAFQKKCLDKMNDVSKSEGRTILYVSHNMNTIRQLCNRCIVLNHGKVTFDGDVEEGISIYLDADRLSENHLFLAEQKRGSEFVNDDVRMEEMEIDSERSVFLTGNVIPTKLKVNAKAKKENVRIEIGIRSSTNDVYVTRQMNDKLFTLNPGENCLKFDIDVSCLAPGKYDISPEIKAANEYGGVDFLDGLKKVYCFEILPKEGFNKNRPWSTRWSGYYVSPSIQVEVV